MDYRTVLSNFAFTAQVEAEITRLADEALREDHAQDVFPRFSALMHVGMIPFGLRTVKRSIPTGNRRDLFGVFAYELIPGYDDFSRQVMERDEARLEDFLSPEEMRQWELTLLCACALLLELGRRFYPDVDFTIPWPEFVATVRRASVMRDTPTYAAPQ